MTLRLTAAEYAQLTGAAPRPKAPRGHPEADVQAAIVIALRQTGARVLITSRQKKRCPACGRMDHTGDGASLGVPDLLVRRDGWLPATWVGLEVKSPAPAGRLSPAQKDLQDAGGIIVVRSPDDALRALQGQEEGGP